VKVIGIEVGTKERGEFVMEALRTAVEEKRVTLDDMALVTKDDEGKVQVHQTKDVTTGKGATKGALVGALVGLAAPPLLGAAAVGAGVGAIWGKFRDRGVDDSMMKSVGSMIAEGDAVVFALGPDESIDAVADRVREVTSGTMSTFTVDPSSEEVVREASADVSVPEEPS
jgi:uncharacterized membrane protein